MIYNFVIVGAGLAGASTAYHLRRRHQPSPRVLLLEKEATPGAHSSGRNAAMIRRHVDDPAIGAMTEPGADRLAQGQMADFMATGSVFIGLGDQPASRRFPLAQGRGLWCPNDGVVDVAGLLNHFLEDQELRCNTQVLDWHDADPSPGHQQAPLCINTSAGPVLARTLINAAGPWAGQLGRLPLTPTNRHLFVTTPMPEIGADWPFVWDVVNGLYFRPESGGLLLCACDETPADPGHYSPNPETTVRLAELVNQHQPRLGPLRIKQTWVGQRTFARDRRFVIGFDPRDRRIFHLAGLGGHGVTSSPAVGALAAELLLDVDARPKTAFDPSRLL
ncbi:MAG: NAD(P)/FAD-dependent oxidoreductase [Phycisphaerae bacterium]